MRFGQAITALLSQYGVDTVFGIPGVHTLELFRDINETNVTPVIPRHEQGAAFMADAYARVTGKPGVCYLITGPGVLNALTPIAQAWHDSIPMLIIASTVHSNQFGAHRGTLHDTPDIAETLRDYTFISENVTTPERFVEVIDEAFSRWNSERPRPVYIGVPLDILEQEVGTLVRPHESDHLSLPRPDKAALDSAFDRIRKAREPIIIAGGGARYDGALIAQLAELIDAPVVMTGNAKGLVPADDPLFAGVSLPFANTQEILAQADLILALGTELSDSEYLFTGSAEPPLHDVVRVDIDRHATHTQQTEPALTMRVAAFVAVSLDVLQNTITAPPRERTGRARAAHARAGLTTAKVADPYAPWIEAINRVLPDNAIVALDSAQVAYQSHHYLDVHTRNRWLAPYGFGTLGPALPMAIGAAVACHDTPVLALAGDGGLLFTIAELATAEDLGRQLTVVVWNNSGYKEIEASFERADIRPAGVATTSHNLHAICSGFGAHTETVETPQALATALADSFLQPHLSVIIIDAPPHLRIGAHPNHPLVQENNAPAHFFNGSRWHSHCRTN